MRRQCEYNVQAFLHVVRIVLVNSSLYSPPTLFLFDVFRSHLIPAKLFVLGIQKFIDSESFSKHRLIFDNKMGFWEWV